jgi:hypothetical protein
MAELFPNKYITPFRIVTGTPQLFPNDVVLLCNTSVAPVILNMLDIPSNFWSTQWSLYIVDNSNNASVNNITINAGVGQVINGIATMVISTNGAYTKIVIGGNASFLSQNSTGGGGYNTIQDEGIALTQRTIMNFIGGGVTATDDAPNLRTNITITGGASIIDITNASYLALIVAGTIVVGQFYRITNPLFADEGVVIQGIRTNVNATLQGAGVFFNADYQGVGNYSGVVGFVAFRNMWNSNNPIVVVIGDVIIYRNIHYVSLTGIFTSGATPNLEPLNWQPLAKSLTNGYIKEVDFVKYNGNTNEVIYRADKRNNEVDLYINSFGQNNFFYFQWGRNLVTLNKLRCQSTMLTSQSYATITANRLDNALLEDNTQNIEPGLIADNELLGGGIISLNDTRGFVTNNNLKSGGSLVYSGLGRVGLTSGISSNEISQNSQIQFSEINSNAFITKNYLITDSTLQVGVVSDFNVEKNYLSCDGTLIATSTSGVGFGFVRCEISDNIVISFPVVSALYTERKYYKGFSNWTLLLTNADWVAGSLNIPIGSNYCGIFNYTGLAVLTSQIANLSANHRSTFTANAGSVLNFSHTLIGVAVANQLISNNSPIINSLIGRVNGNDVIEYGRSGIFNQRFNVIINA